MILLDTHVLLWLHAGKKRTRVLDRWLGRLCASPVSVLEIQMLIDIDRLGLRRGATVHDLLDDERFSLDDIPSVSLFSAARLVDFTRDPFDRLLVGHARARGWKLATADTRLLDCMDGTELLEV